MKRPTGPNFFKEPCIRMPLRGDLQVSSLEVGPDVSFFFFSFTGAMTIILMLLPAVSVAQSLAPSKRKRKSCDAQSPDQGTYVPTLCVPLCGWSGKDCATQWNGVYASSMYGPRISSLRFLVFFCALVQCWAYAVSFSFSNLFFSSPLVD